jgi:hypothetical protein
VVSSSTFVLNERLIEFVTPKSKLNTARPGAIPSGPFVFLVMGHWARAQSAGRHKIGNRRLQIGQMLLIDLGSLNIIASPFSVCWRCAMREVAFVVAVGISFFIRLNVQAVWAGDVADESARQDAGEDDVVARVYRLKYLRTADFKGLIAPLLSLHGKISVSQDDGSVLVICDKEKVLKNIDSVVAELDVPPPVVVFEAAIIRVDSVKTAKIGGEASVFDQTLGFHASESVDVVRVFSSDGTVAGCVDGNKIGFMTGSIADAIRILEDKAEIMVLACPRVWVLNKQAAQIHLGVSSGEKTGQSQAKSSEAAVSPDIETMLRVRPFVSSDDHIRLELHFIRSAASKDSKGIPISEISQVTTTVLIPNGNTIVCGKVADFEDEKDAKDAKKSPAAKAAPKKKLLLLLSAHIAPAESAPGKNAVAPSARAGRHLRTRSIIGGFGRRSGRLFHRHAVICWTHEDC